MAPIPVLAAGGIGRGRQVAAALALGAEGVWCGSVWLTTRESDANPILRKRLLAATSPTRFEPRPIRASRRGFLKSAWSDAWEKPGAPQPLMRPLQYLVRFPAYARTDRVGAEDFVTSPVGQIVGNMNEETTVRQVVYDMLLEFSETVERLNKLLE
jgi:NAD(P)H-dependent flavin oxidoreductase YrpB (nitropropane dioxygenase family)